MIRINNILKKMFIRSVKSRFTVENQRKLGWLRLHLLGIESKTKVKLITNLKEKIIILEMT